MNVSWIRGTSVWTGVVIAALAGVVGEGLAAAAPPEVRFAVSEVSVTGATPGGRVVVWWLAQGVSGYTRWQSRQGEVVVDADGDGAVTVAPPRGVPEQSLWVVVDLASGEVALASPLAGPLREVEPPPGVAGGLVGRGELEEERRRLEVLVVRPGVDEEAGAWSGGLDDGGPGDGDGTRDGRARARLAGLVPVAADGAAAPSAFRAGDVVVAGSAEELVYWLRRVGDPAGEPPAGGEVAP
jgi:hypothetical protein